MPATSCCSAIRPYITRQQIRLQPPLPPLPPPRLLCTPPKTKHTHAEYKHAKAPNLARRRLYRNGVLLAEDDCQSPDVDDHHTLLLGRFARDTHSPLHGGLCDVRLYSRALEADEVHAARSVDDTRCVQMVGTMLERWTSRR